MNGAVPKSFAAVLELCTVTEAIDDYPIESWLKSAKTLYMRAQTAKEHGDLVEAYIWYSKTYEICCNGIPDHHRYAEWKIDQSAAASLKEYLAFRRHLLSELDQLVHLRTKVKSFFSSRRLSAVSSPKSDPAIEASSSDSITRRLQQLNGLAGNSDNASNSQTRTILANDTTKGKPSGARPLFSKSITIEPSKLLNYIRDFPSLSILFLDIRPSPTFENNHIECPTIVNIDPVVCRAQLCSQDIEDSFAVGPEEQLKLFEKRHEYDLLVFYDQQSTSLLPAEASRLNYHPDALQNLHAALWERAGWKKPLARAPVLLIGGIEAWQAAGGSTTSSIGQLKEEELTRGHGARSLLVQQPIYASGDVSNKKKNRGTSIVEAAEPSYPRSVHEYIFSDLSKKKRSIIEEKASHLSVNTEMKPTSPLAVNRRPASPAVKREVGPYLENGQMPERPRRAGAAPIYTRQPSVGSQTSRLGQTSIGKIGLKNLGNSCFMNAVIQCLAACFPLARYFTSGQWRFDVTPKNPLGYQGRVANEFAKVLREMNSDDNSVIAPVDLRNELGRTRPEFADNQQQDAQELLNFLLDAVHEDLNANAVKPQLRELTEEEESYRETLNEAFVSDTEWKRYTHRNLSIIVKLFQGQLQSRLRCRSCGHTSTTYNAFSTLSLPIPTSRSGLHLEDCINEFVKSEDMKGDDSWWCPKCKLMRETTKKLSISRLPDVLIVHFKRFESKGRWRDKLNTNIQFPLTGLDMSKYSRTSQTSAAADAIYDIFGIVYHRGSMEGGHYTAMINPNAQREDWTLFDDSRVAPNNEIDGRASYLLFYSKRPNVL